MAYNVISCQKVAENTQILKITKFCSLNIVFFPQNVVIFLNSANSAAALVFYLPGVCTHTDTEGKQRKARVRNIFKNSEKNTIFNEQLVSSGYLHLKI